MEHGDIFINQNEAVKFSENCGRSSTLIKFYETKRSSLYTAITKLGLIILINHLIIPIWGVEGPYITGSINVFRMICTYLKFKGQNYNRFSMRGFS